MTETTETDARRRPLGDQQPSFDVALGVRREALQRAIDKMYPQLYQKYFKGSVTVGKRDVLYDVKAAPRLDFTPVPNLAAMIKEQLDELPPVEGKPMLKSLSAADRQALTATAETMMIRMHFDSIEVTIKSASGEGKTKAKAEVFIKISTENAKIQFTATKATASTPNPDDEYILNAVIIPAVLKLAAQLMTAIQIPTLSVAGITFDWPAGRIMADYFVIMTKLLNRHMPLGLDAPLPRDNPEAFVIVSPWLMQPLFDNVTKGVKHTESDSGGDPHGAYWRASVTVSDIKGVASGVEFPISAACNGSALGGIWLPVVPNLEVDFGASASPNPSGIVKAEIDRATNKIRAKIAYVNPFIITFTAQSWLARVVEAVMGFLLSFASLLSPLFTRFLTGISFDIWSIPELPISFDNVRLTLRASDLAVSGIGQHVYVTGGVKIT